MSETIKYNIKNLFFQMPNKCFIICISIFLYSSATPWCSLQVYNYVWTTNLKMIAGGASIKTWTSFTQQLNVLISVPQTVPQVLDCLFPRSLSFVGNFFHLYLRIAIGDHCHSCILETTLVSFSYWRFRLTK